MGPIVDGAGVATRDGNVPAGPANSRLRLSSAIIILILLGFVLLRIAGWIYRMDIPVVWDHAPHLRALGVHRVTSGATLYPDIRTSLSTSVYPPISTLLASVIAPLFGDGVLAALIAGRTLVITSTLLVSFMIFVLARNFGATAAASLIAALAFLCSPLLEPWGFEFRVDMPALAFGITALWVFWKGYEFPAVLLCVLSFFCKQSSGEAMAAIVLFLCFQGKLGRAVALASTWLGLVIALTVLFEWIWPFYLLSTFTAVRAGYLDLSAPSDALFSIFILEIPLAILAAAAIISRRTTLLPMLFLASTLLDNLTGMFRWGANLYYFLPTVAAMSIVAAPQLDWLLEKVAHLRWSLAVPCAVTIGAALFICNLKGQFHRFLQSPIHSISPTTVYPRSIDQNSLQIVDSIDGPVLADEPTVLLADPSPELRPINLMVLGGMKANGLFDDTRLLEEIRCRRFAAFALDSSLLNRNYRGRFFFWPKLRQAIEANYELAAPSGPPFVMVPKPGTPCP